MSKKHDWMDYTNLAANLAQANRLAEIQQELARLQHAEANKQRQVEFEDKLRQFIFHFEEKIDLYLRRATATAPKAAFITARLVERIFDNSGVDPVSFQQFADKDRVKQVRSKLLDVLVTSREQLNAGEQEEASLCVKFIVEMSSLNEFIETQDAREKLATTENKWQQLDAIETKKVNSRRKIGGFLLLVSILSCVATLYIANGLKDILTSRLILTAGTLASMALFAFGLIALVAYKSQETYARLKVQRKAWESHVPAPDKLNQLTRMFGETTKSSELIVMRDERSRRIQQAVSYDKQGNLLSSPLINILDW